MTSSETDISGVQTGDMISEHVLVRLSLRAKKLRQGEECMVQTVFCRRTVL